MQLIHELILINQEIKKYCINIDYDSLSFSCIVLLVIHYISCIVLLIISKFQSRRSRSIFLWKCQD